jgi:hypothetical protein
MPPYTGPQESTVDVDLSILMDVVVSHDGMVNHTRKWNAARA